MDFPLVPTANGNAGSAVNLLAQTVPPNTGQPVVNQPPVWTRAQAMPQVNVPLENPGIATPPTGFGQAPAWRRETTPSVTPPMTSGAVSIDLGGYSTTEGIGAASGPGGMTGAGAAIDVANAANVAISMDPRGQIQSVLNGYFEPYINAGNRTAFEALINDRTGALHAMGHTPERIENNVAKANQFDWLSAVTTGAVNSLPFAGASGLLTAVPAITAPAAGSPAGTGFIAGGVSAAVDSFGSSLLNAGTRNSRWLKPGPEQLEPVMAQAVQEQAPRFWGQAAQTAAAFQTYSLRNAVRTAVVPAVYAAAGEAARTTVDNTLAIAGGPIAGAGAYAALRKFDQANLQDGAALFLGQTNWADLYRQLDSATWRTQLTNGGVRVARFPLDVLTGSLEAGRSLLRPAPLAQFGVLAGGFAATTAATSAVGQAMQAAGYSGPATEAVTQGLNTVLSAPVFAGWTTAALGADPLASAAAQSIQNIGRQHTALELGDPDVTAPATGIRHRHAGVAGSGAEQIELGELTRSLIDRPLQGV